VAAAAIAAGVTAGQAPASATSNMADAARQAATHAPVKHTADHTQAASSDHGATSNSGAKQAPPAKHAAPAKKAPAKHAPVKHHAKRKPYLIYDSVTPSALPRHNAVATYATGNYAASPSQVAGHKTVLWIDTTGYDHAASVLDVEPGDATPAMAGTWVFHRLHNNPHAIARLYTMQSEWPAVKAAVAKLPAHMRAQVRYWIADPTGSPHLVPGSDATQWSWGNSVDISTATPRF